MHEKSHHRDNEQRIAEIAAEAWQMEISKAPPLCTVDGCFFKGPKPFAFFECKKRNYKLRNLADVWIDKKKLTKAFLGAKEAGISLVLLFEFDDGVFFCPIKTQPDFKTKFDGPTKKRDAHDVDEVFLIPQANWRKVAPVLSNS